MVPHLLLQSTSHGPPRTSAHPNPDQDAPWEPRQTVLERAGAPTREERPSLPGLAQRRCLLLGAALGLYIRFLYDRFGRSSADSDSVSRVFPLLTVVTTGIIAVIKSSLALSLGLVGALSIVRFRAAIKEPEELVYLFLCIGVGLCLGAEQPVLAVLVVVAASVLVTGTRVLGRNARRQNVILTITGDAAHFGDPQDGALAALEALAGRYSVQRYDLEKDEGQLRIFIGSMKPGEATRLMNDLRKRLPECQLSFVNLDSTL